MLNLLSILIFLLACSLHAQEHNGIVCNDENAKPSCSLPSHADYDENSFPYQLTDAQWKQKLSAEAYTVLRQKGTEPAFSGEYYKKPKPFGIYRCAGCGIDLFDVGKQFNSGTGWPSFYDTTRTSNVATAVDTSYGMRRVEVHCANCGGHLGHVFEDGPNPTGLRYCINSVALEFYEPLLNNSVGR